MKLIIAIIKPFRLEDVRDGLTAEGVEGLTVTDVRGYGRQKGQPEIYRGAEYVTNFVPKVKIELVVEDSQLDVAMSVIQKNASSDKIGDGKIFVLPVEQSVRIRTGETGIQAL